MARAVEPLPPPPFAGFPPEAFAFLRELAARQDRAWMAENKAVFERSLREPLAALVAAVAEGLAQADSPLRGDPKGSVFRIHRDTRFSKDKSPYKTNVGASLSRNGDKLAPGLLYIHIDPQGCFLAAGFYHPEPPVLHRLRQRLADRPEAWRATEAQLAQAGLTPTLGEALVRAPRGFEAIDDPALVERLKQKSWLVSRPVTEDETGRPAFVQRVLDFAEQARPLLEFGWAAIDG